MCFFFSCSSWHKPTTCLKDTCNQFGFGLILESKDGFSISENNDCANTSVFSSTIFQKCPKLLVLGPSTPFFLKTWFVGKFLFCSECKMLREYLKPFYLQNPCSAGLSFISISVEVSYWCTFKLFNKLWSPR